MIFSRGLRSWKKGASSSFEGSGNSLPSQYTHRGSVWSAKTSSSLRPASTARRMICRVGWKVFGPSSHRNPSLLCHPHRQKRPVSGGKETFYSPPCATPPSRKLCFWLPPCECAPCLHIGLEGDEAPRQPRPLAPNRGRVAPMSALPGLWPRAVLQEAERLLLTQLVERFLFRAFALARSRAFALDSRET